MEIWKFLFVNFLRRSPHESDTTGFPSSDSSMSSDELVLERSDSPDAIQSFGLPHVEAARWKFVIQKTNVV